MTIELSRRGMLAGLAAVGASVGLGGLARGSMLERPLPKGAAAKRSIRLAHLTDSHIQPELGADQGTAACFRHAQSQKDKPELILTGGDHVMDSLATDDARTTLQWDLWKKVLKSESSLPVKSAVGNHDCWGWNKKKSKTAGTEANYGKKRACEVFGREKPYTSWDQAGWHFVILDSITDLGQGDGGYLGRLDNEQLAWLEGDLAGVKKETPVLILSHIPIVAGCIWDGNTTLNAANKLEINGGLVHTDAGALIKLFQKHPNVKLCISGHVHLVDRVDYNGVTYLCNGAVSGGWWKGNHKQCEPGYAMIDLFDDGTFKSEYQTYGWKAKS
ncbi:MAG: metallophosphoesterase [Planctomycetota bacterium]